jgi:transcription termination factor NusB
VDQHTTNKADKAKRRKTRELIEQELYTYEQTREQIKQRIAEIDDIASPRSNWPPIGRVSGEKGDVVAFVEGGNGRDRGQHSDPTPDRAQKVSDYKEKVLGGKVFREMVERVEAIEKVLNVLRMFDAAGLEGARIQLHIIQRKYFERASDETVWTELGISRTQFYRYRMAIIQAVARHLGWIV